MRGVNDINIKVMSKSWCRNPVKFGSHTKVGVAWFQNGQYTDSHKTPNRAKNGMSSVSTFNSTFYFPCPSSST